MLYWIAIFAASAFISLTGAVLARSVAVRFHILAVPGGRHRHSGAIPLLGGVGIYAALIAAFIVIYILDGHLYTIGLFAGITSFFFLIGIWDDIRPLSASTKLLLQVAAAGIFVYLALDVSFLPVGSAFFIRALAVIWILAITNGMNFMDGLDGLCTGMTFLMSMCLIGLMMMWGQGNNPYTLISIVVAGATLGFLRVNKHPATMFLGDCGSLQLGCVLAITSLLCMQYIPMPICHGIGSVLLCFAIPIADCGLTLIRRIRLGRPLFKSDWGHIHQRLLDVGFEHGKIVRILWGVQCALSVLALLVVRSTSVVGYLGISAGIIWLAVLYGLLRYKELRAVENLPVSLAYTQDHDSV